MRLLKNGIMPCCGKPIKLTIRTPALLTDLATVMRLPDLRPPEETGKKTLDPKEFDYNAMLRRHDLEYH
jgi:hypothetical protein